MIWNNILGVIWKIEVGLFVVFEDKLVWFIYFVNKKEVKIIIVYFLK